VVDLTAAGEGCSTSALPKPQSTHNMPEKQITYIPDNTQCSVEEDRKIKILNKEEFTLFNNQIYSPRSHKM
jgi:hypothetical protein